MYDVEQYQLPFPACPPVIPVHVLPVTRPVSPLLVELDKAKPGDITGMFASYSADFERWETLHQDLEAFFIAGRTEPEAQPYERLPTPMRGQAAQVALEHFDSSSCINEEAVDRGVVDDFPSYTLFVFTFASVRIVLNAEFFSDPADFFHDIEIGLRSDIRPCVIEVYGEMLPTVRADVARRHLI